MNILYIRDSFPKLSETFIMEELLALRKRGHRLRVVASTVTLSRIQPKVLEHRLLDHVIYVRQEHTSVLGSLHWFPRNVIGRLLEPSRLRRYPEHLLPHRTLAREAAAKLYETHARPSPGRARALYLELVNLIDMSVFVGNLSLAIGQYVETRTPFEPDVIYVPFSFKRDLLLLAAMRRRFPRCPAILCCRSRDLFSEENSELPMWRDAIASADRVVTISKFNARTLRARIPELREVAIVHSAIDTELFRPDPAAKKIPRRIITVGRLIAKKGLEFLIEACRMLRAGGFDFSCVIVGDGPREASLRESIAAHDLGGHVRIVGMRSQAEVRALLDEAEIFVLPCRVAHDRDRDVLPNALKEAMAMMLPVITSNISGIDELVTDNVDGILVPSGSPAHLAGAILRLAADPALRAELGRAARAKVVANFDATAEAAKLSQILDEARRAHGRSAASIAAT